MEFVGNQINFRTVLATLTVAFFIGRINLFGGTYPAAVALMAVMLSVSTLYIYLLPVECLAIAVGQAGSVDSNADIIAVILCGAFFLFFHSRKFTYNQRILISVLILVISKLSYYFAIDDLDSLDILYLIGECLALGICIVLFDGLAQIIYAPKDESVCSKEKIPTYDLKRDLERKRDTFRSLSRICAESGNGQMLSYQFDAMARMVERFLKEVRREDFGMHSASESISVGGASYSAAKVSGDSSKSFGFDGNKQALVISDGMGKGRDAAPTSRMVVSTLSKLLEAGFDVDIALKTINEILLGGNNEMFASLDMIIINKDNRRAQVFKMGAATTFIRHGDSVAMLKKAALPVGVASPINLEYLDVKLSRGDIVVMVSDGVSDCDRNDRNCRWLTERLTHLGSRDPDTIAELIINKAVEKYGIKERDDLTVLVAVV